MKRAFPQKIKPVACQLSDCELAAGQSKQSVAGVNRRARTSAAMIGLALSMGASSLLLPRQDDGAVAAEPLQVEPTATTVIPLPEQIAPQQSDTEPESSSSRSESATGIAHVVRPGETLWSIAQRYQVDVQVLASANDISNNSVLRVGQTLQVPGATSHSDLSATAESTEGNDALRAERNTALSRLREQRDKLRTSLSGLQAEPIDDVAVADVKEDATLTSTPTIPSSPALVKDRVPSAANEIASSPTPGTIVHRVKPGDTLAAIAERYGVSRTEVAHANQIVDFDQLQVNQVLVIPTSVTPDLAERGATVSSSATYRVVPGDTLSEIARIHNVSRASLMSLNDLSNPNFILVGQVLQIPETGSSLTGNHFETATNTLSTTTELTAPSAQFAPEGSGSGSATLAQVPEVTGMPTIPMPPSAQPTIVASTADVSFSPEFSESQPAPQEVAVAPLSTPAPATNPSTVISPSASSTNPYVENLMSEIYSMRDRLREQNMETASVPVVQQPTVVAAVGGTTAPAERINPEFNPERFNQLEATRPQQTTVAPVQTTESSTTQNRTAPAQPDVVAVAPLGSESYAPLLQPLAGQLVSPELPALPDATAYLPDSPGSFNGYMWPAQGVLTSGFGWRWGRMHRGIDIGAPVGTPVHAAADGVVEFSGWNSGGYGNMVEIRHPDGSMTRYAHHSRNLVRAGQEVRQGEQIAEVGSTGYSTGPHLHFEVHLPNQGTVNPIAYLPR